MKYLWWFIGIIIFIFILFYVVLFTSFGNNIVKPILQGEIITKTMLPIKVTTFSLSTNHLDLKIDIDKHNSLSLIGNYSLFSKNLNFKYGVHLDRLQTLQKVTKVKLYGNFNTNGTIKGTLDLINIDGISNIAQSKTNYHITLTKFNPTSVIAEINGAKIQSLLAMIGKKQYIKADANLKINFKNLTSHKLDGYAKFNLLHTLFNYKLIHNDFNITVPKTSLVINLLVSFKNDDANYKYLLSSNLAHITSNGIVTLQPLHVNSRYKAHVQNLALLTPIVNIPLRGMFNLSGIIKGDTKNLYINSYSKTLKGSINVFVRGKILRIKLNNIQTIPLLYMLKYPTIFSSSVIANLSYNTAKKAGVLQGKLINGHFTQNIILGLVKQYTNTDLYKERFNGNINTKIDKYLTNSTISLKSNSASIDTKNMLLNSKTDKINASIHIMANKNPLIINLHGKIQKPDVSIDAKKLLQKKASKAIKKEIGNFLKKLF